MTRIQLGGYALVWVVVSSAALVLAEEPGLTDLDAAVETKLFSQTPGDLDRVVALCESALAKGLNDENTKFAKLLAAATLYQYASALCQPIFDQPTPDPRWPLLRGKALPKLEQAVTINESFGEAHYLIARLEGLPGGDRDKALAAVGKAIRLAGDDARQLSQALVLRGDLSDGDAKLADYNQAIAIDPTNKEALKARGLFYLNKNDSEKASEDFKRILEQESNNLTAHHALAELFTNLEKYDEALQHIESAMQIDANSPVNYTLRARIHLHRNDTKSALDDVNAALRLDPRNVAALLMRAHLHREAGDLDAANKDVERLLLFQPDLEQGILLRSLISASQGDFPSAAADLERLLKSDPKNVPWRLQLASFYVADKRPSKAIKVYAEVLDDEPQNVLGLRGRGDALLSLGRQAEAIADYEAALVIDPNDSGVLNNLAWVLATSTDEKLRDGKRSIQLGLKACEVTDYKQAHILSTLAAGYAETGDYETAIKWSSKAVELGQGDTKQQLEQELESYKNKKPWREQQKVEENREPTRGGGDFEL